jgi:class 3 adenylate cyclase
MAMLVTEGQRGAWEQYSIENKGWIQESYQHIGLDDDATSVLYETSPYIFRRHKNGTQYEDNVEADQYAPFWLASPMDKQFADVNYNSLDDPVFTTIHGALADEATITVTSPSEESTSDDLSDVGSWPKSTFAVPLFENFEEASRIVAVLGATVAWHHFFADILKEGVVLDLVIQDSCGKPFSYEIDGPSVLYRGVGVGDLPNDPHNDLGVTTTPSSFNLTNGCSLRFDLYPSPKFVAASASRKSWLYTTTVLLIFAFMAVFFIVYDRLAAVSYKSAVHQVERSKTILDSNVRDRIFEFDEDVPERMNPMQLTRHRSMTIAKPIADLHPNATVLFADIANFTAWSSVREPAQVFTLLETLYNEYDKLAKKYKIFKVETIRDCYVAVSGLPEPRDDHAVLMARFAHDALVQMRKSVQQLEVSLGPDTGDLAMRVGFHSGPVTAGVLRGEKSRFQLFGDTVNTASRMESTGGKNRIQVSSDTADLIEEAGHSRWLTPRKDLVSVKGKGEMRTFWLSVGRAPLAESEHDGSEEGSEGFASSPFRARMEEKSAEFDLRKSVSSTNDKTERLVNWSVDLLLGLLKRITAMRESKEELNELREFQEMVKGLNESGDLGNRTMDNIDGAKSKKEPKILTTPHMTVLDEVKEIITLPRKAAKYQQDPGDVQLGDKVVIQLHDYVQDVANMYRNNPFHNFEHASHVTQSLTKLLSRVVTADEIDYDSMRYKKKAATSKLHKFTYGITSDPITQFACAFSAIIHDLDHPGVPNAVLVKEETRIAQLYRNQSVAEQNSVDLAWGLLMEPRFKDLRHCIYTTQAELDRFRQLVVNSVMATDIVDKELGALRKKRWETAFNKEATSELEEKERDEVNRKATIVIEHLIQAADVAHTMQHWQVYLKWNERFFRECYQAFLDGRADKDPSEGWYKGEIGFFDFYIIPLAKKLESCGVFGVSSCECLQYAKANRSEWERKGEGIVEKYLSAYKGGKRSSRFIV